MTVPQDLIERGAVGDRTNAEALRIAHAILEKLGWRYSAADVGKTAAEILSALQSSEQSK